MKRGAALAMVCVACGGKELAEIPPPPPALDGSVVDAGTIEPDAAEAAADVADIGDAIALVDAWAGDADAYGAWCAANAPYATLCDDFDAPNAPRIEWTPFGTGLDVVTSTSTSSPHALHVKTASPSYLAFTTMNAPYGMKIDANVRLDADGTSVTSGGLPVLMGIEAEHGQTMDLAIVPGTSKARLMFAGVGSGPSYTECSLPRDGAWHAVTMKISFGQPGMLDMICMIDSTDCSSGVVTGSQNLGKVMLVVGARGTTSSSIEAYFDDVVIDG